MNDVATVSLGDGELREEGEVVETWEGRRRCWVYKAENAGGADVWLHAVDMDTDEDLVFRLTGHRPYFYADPPSATELHHPSILGKEVGYRSITERPVTKITTKKPGDVRLLRSQVEEPYEADVPYVKRVCIDTEAWGICDIAFRDNGQYYETRPDWIEQVDQTPEQELDVVYLDIEGGNIFDVENAKDEVFCIGLYDRKMDEWRLWSYHPINDTNIETVETNKHGTVLVEHEHFVDTEERDGEQMMFKAFLAWLRDRRPMAISGWNSGRGAFDLPYLINRSKRLGIREREWGRYGHLDADWLNIPGTHSLDLLKVHKRALYGGFQDNSLKNVAEIFCNITLHKDPDDIHDWWLNSQEELFRYNVKDVEATYLIDEVQDYGGFAKASAFMTYCTDLESIELDTIMLDGLFLYHAQQRGVILPMRKAGTDWRSGGAYVIPPKPGLHDKVISLDVSSLYPSITVGCDISYENVTDEPGKNTFTLGYDPDVRDRHEDGYYGRLEQEEEVEFVHFDQQQEGLIPVVAKELWKMKKGYGKEIKNADTDEEKTKYETLYSAAKITLNSASYGIGNTNHFRLGRQEVGEGITGMGRTITKAMARRARELGYEVVAGDTDAVHCVPLSDDIEDIADEVEDLIPELEDAMAEEAEKRGARQPELFELEWEALSNPFFAMPVKKKYAYRMVVEDGEVLDEPETKFKGLEIVRSSSSDYTQQMMKTAFYGVLEEGWTRDELLDYLNDKYVEVRSGNVDIYRVATRERIKRDIPTYWNPEKSTWTSHVAQAADEANERFGKNFVAGSRPYILRLAQKPDDYDANYIALEEGDDIPEGCTVDWVWAAEQNVKKRMENALEAVGYAGRGDGLGMRSLDDF